LKRALQIIVPPLVGIGILVLFLSKFTDQQFAQIKDSISRAQYSLILVSVLLGLASHVLRALRWEHLLRTVTNRRLNKWNLIFAVGISYLMNLGIPRSGEVSRAVTVQKYEGIPFNKAFGTIITERLIDLVMLGLFVLVGFFLSYNEIARMLGPAMPDHPLILSVFLLMAAAGAYWLWRKSRHWHHPWVRKIHVWIRELKTGMLSLARIRRPGWFILQTIVIWLLYLLMLWVVMLAFPETRHLGWDAVIMAFLAGSISIVISNGGIGTYPVFVTEVLTLYGVSKEAGFAFSTVMWSAQTLMLILAGILSFIFLPWVNGRSAKAPSRY